MTFTDDTFVNEDWTVTKIQDNTPDHAGSVQAQQMATGGNPAHFRLVTLNFVGGGEIQDLLDTAHVREQFVYEPAAGGAIGALRIPDYDLIGIEEEGSGIACRYFSLLRQGDSLYSASAGRDDVQPGAWVSTAHAGLTAANFNRLTGTGPQQPDFSVAGAPIYFGYRNLGASFAGEALCVTGLDNFSVTVTPAETFRTMTLDGPDDPPGRRRGPVHRHGEGRRRRSPCRRTGLVPSDH